jgi:hypothetical protein
MEEAPRRSAPSIINTKTESGILSPMKYGHFGGDFYVFMTRPSVRLSNQEAFDSFVANEATVALRGLGSCLMFRAWFG